MEGSPRAYAEYFRINLWVRPTSIGYRRLVFRKGKSAWISHCTHAYLLPTMLRVSDAGRSQRCGLHRGRRPKAFNEGTRGKWQAVAPRAPERYGGCARRRWVRATDADECV